jgi:transmembrane sensor
MSIEALLNDEEFLEWYYNPSQEHAKKWEDRVSKQENLKSLVPVAIQILNHVLHEETTVTEREIENSRKKLIQRINEWQDNPIEKPKKSRSNWWWIAASILLVMDWLFNTTYSNKELQNTYNASISTIKQIRLDDSTLIRLNAGSTIRTSNFSESGSDREVWLEGEAYFDVAHTPDHRKFIVHSEDIDIEVLGTQFNIRKEKEQTQIILESGQVQLSVASIGTHIMKPGEMVQYSSQTKKITSEVVNPEDYISWKDADIIFENAESKEIIRVLRDVFKYEVIIENDLDLGYFNGSFSSKDPDILLRALEKTYDGRFHRQPGKIIIQ